MQSFSTSAVTWCEGGVAGGDSTRAEFRQRLRNAAIHSFSLLPLLPSCTWVFLCCLCTHYSHQCSAFSVCRREECKPKRVKKKTDCNGSLLILHDRTFLTSDSSASPVFRVVLPHCSFHNPYCAVTLLQSAVASFFFISARLPNNTCWSFLLQTCKSRVASGRNYSGDDAHPLRTFLFLCSYL